MPRDLPPIAGPLDVQRVDGQRLAGPPKEPLPPHRYPKLARSLGKRQEPKPAAPATVMLPATET
jgi:hypothetical protein